MTTPSLSTPSRSRTERPDPETLPPLKMTGSRRRVLELLHRYRYLTPRMIALAYDTDRARKAGLSSHVRQELAALWKHGLIERYYDGKRPTGQGSEEYIYTLSPQGGRRVLDKETYSQHRQKIFRRSKREQGNYDHHLALTSLQLILELGASGWSVGSFRPDERTPASRFTVPGQGTHQPDAWVQFILPSEVRPLYLFEVDLEHKNNQRTDQRFAAYAEYLTSPETARMLQREDATYAAAVFVVRGETEIERMLERAITVLQDRPRRQLPQFFFWNMEGWYESRRMNRREAVGTDNQRTREWTITTVRDPRAILAEPPLCDLHGKPRWLLPLHDSAREE